MKITSKNLRRAEKSRLELIKVYRKCASRPGRHRMTDYLVRVFEVHRIWDRENTAHKRSYALWNIANIKNRKDKTPLSILIESTSAAETRTRSDWHVALGVAHDLEWSPEDLRAHLLEKGGGITGLLRKARSKKKQDAGKRVFSEW